MKQLLTRIFLALLLGTNIHANEEKSLENKVNNEISEESNKALNIMGWGFVGFFIWFILLYNAHNLRMNDDAKKVFFYITLVVIVITLMLVRRFIKIDTLFVVGISLLLSITLSNMIIPFLIHSAFSNIEKVPFRIVKKEQYISCFDGDGEQYRSDSMDTDCELVKNICIQNKSFKKFDFCTGMLSEEDWKNTKKGDDIIIKGKMSFLGIKPVSYVLLDGQSNLKVP